jgi:predicted O-methyltransferase YrrM
MMSGSEVWDILEKEQLEETKFGEQHTPIRAPQVKWLAEQASTYPNGTALDIGFGCGFSSIAMALGGDMAVVAPTTDKPDNDRFNRAEGRCKTLSDGKIDFRLGIASEVFLPREIAEGRSFDIIFVDGGHRFDDVLLDVHFASRLLSAGGLLALDDTHFGAIRSVANWLNTNMSHIWEPFEIAVNTVSWKRTAVDDRDSREAHRVGSGQLVDFSITTEEGGQYQYQPRLDPLLKGKFRNPS